MRLRGMEAVAPERFAEAFTCRKVVLGRREMRFVPTRARRARTCVELERHEDERGFFARTWCRDEFAEHGLEPGARAVQHLAQRARGNAARHALPAAPHEEAKLVRCTARRDLRRDRRSPAGLADARGVVRSRARRGAGNALYVPKGFAHGFQTLTDGAEVLYMISDPYVARGRRGVRWDDPAFGIEWPGGGARERSASATWSWPDYQAPGSRREPRRVELVAPDLVDPREQLVEIVERVDEAAVELVGRAAREPRDQPRRAARRRRRDPCRPPAASAAGLRLVRWRVISVRVKPGATENALTPCSSSDAASASVRLATPAFPAA